ncbi:MAG TPA: hypothetical protein VKX28_11305 [Xanthobacteraceae bacterium]|jgi:hypothetical protein|nr:hypothetical protein [Xanthobacteraceae bacterium]
MRNLIRLAAIAGALLGCVTVSQAQSGQQSSTEAGVGNAQSHGAYGYGFGGAYAQYGGHLRHHRHYR